MRAVQSKPLLVEKYGEFYGEEKLIWAASWGGGVGGGGRKKKERNDDVEVSWERKRGEKI